MGDASTILISFGFAFILFIFLWGYAETGSTPKR
jgi:hypothetical protein